VLCKLLSSWTSATKLDWRNCRHCSWCHCFSRSSSWHRLLHILEVDFFSLSLSLIPGWGGGHRPNPFQVAPEAPRIGCEGVSWPGVPPGVIVGRTLEHQMLDRLVGTVALWADGRVPATDTVKVSCYQWGMTSAYLCHRHALVPGPIPLPTLVPGGCDALLGR